MRERHPKIERKGRETSETGVKFRNELAVEVEETSQSNEKRRRRQRRWILASWRARINWITSLLPPRPPSPSPSPTDLK